MATFEPCRCCLMVKARLVDITSLLLRYSDERYTPYHSRVFPSSVNRHPSNLLAAHLERIPQAGAAVLDQPGVGDQLLPLHRLAMTVQPDHQDLLGVAGLDP